ncbi:sensor domain-containing diguanylate cyclase [Butyrivibrio sp. CB08]|uniref:sensor domain-containing diguanylate cyclase n=1 Tax=Butyrivibrio sp. CB08 TaxID=2364879 RepID=UPI0013141F30|nr:GGDEF domain-containing protein [Butyrivibrio sp. CB08]
MADKNYEQFKSMVNMVDMPCAVFSVEKKQDGSCGEIIMVATNKAFSMTGEDVEGQPYTFKIPKDPKFEEIAFLAAWQGKPHHDYVDTTRLYGFWTENSFIPLFHDEDSNIGYCQYTYSLTKLMDSGKYSIISPDIASFVIRTCINLRKEEDFYSSMAIVTTDIREFTDSFAASIMTISKDFDTFEVVSGSVRNNAVDVRDIFDKIPYEVVESWESVISDTDCVIVRNEDDMKYLETKAPAWVKTLRENDVRSLCLVPFIHQNTVIGYLYITNFDVSNLTRYKDTIQLVSFFLSSEVAHHLFIDKLRALSNVDVRTGVLNRNAMNTKVDELAVELRYNPRPFSVAFCYLNTLKTVNINKGHDAGNDLLRDAGKVLKEVFEDDYVYRSAGDEFAIISTGCTEEEFKNKINLLKEKASDPEWLYFTIGYYTDSSDGELHSAMRFAYKYENEFKEEFYYSNPDIVK